LRCGADAPALGAAGARHAVGRAGWITPRGPAVVYALRRARARARARRRDRDRSRQPAGAAGSTPHSAASRRRSPAPTTMSAASMPTPISPVSPGAPVAVLATAGRRLPFKPATAHAVQDFTAAVLDWPRNINWSWLSETFSA
jgi:hypothetical protein